MVPLLRTLSIVALAALLAGTPGGSRAQTPPPAPASAIAPLEPQVLLYSDDPENVSQDGLLFRSQTAIDPATPARVYLYHVLHDADQRLYLILETTGSAQVRLVGAAAAGDGKPMDVGHRATREYLRARAAQPGWAGTVSAAAPLVIPVTPDALPAASSSRPAHPLVEAIYDLRVAAGDPVRVSVVSAHAGADPLAAAALSVAGDGYHRQGEFSLVGVPPVRLHFTVGDPCDADHDCETFTAGMASFAQRNGGRPLGGDYGVLRPVELTLTNPQPSRKDVFLYEQAGTAGVTTTIAFAGEDAPTEVPCVLDTVAYYRVKRFTLGPGETRVVTGVYMTDGGSHFPLELGLTATPPATAGDECAQRAAAGAR